MNQIEREEKRREMEGLYRNLITELKILYIRAQYNKEETNEKRYKNAYQKLELIQERRHLTEIGKQGINKEAYINALRMIERTYKENEKMEDTLDKIIDNIEALCEKFNIQNRKNIGERENDLRDER